MSPFIVEVAHNISCGTRSRTKHHHHIDSSVPRHYSRGIIVPSGESAPKAMSSSLNSDWCLCHEDTPILHLTNLNGPKWGPDFVRGVKVRFVWMHFLLFSPLTSVFMVRLGYSEFLSFAFLTVSNQFCNLSRFLWVLINYIFRIRKYLWYHSIAICIVEKNTLKFA